MTARIFVACLLLTAPLAAQPRRVPLREGLTLVRAYRNASGDFEAVTTVSHVDANGVTLSVSSDEGADTCPQASGRSKSAGLRTVLRDDLDSAHALRQEFAACPSAPEIHPGSTAIGVSARVLEELKAGGRTNLSATTSAAGMVAGVLTRIERGTVPVKAIVNDEPIELPAVHARWQSAVGAREYWILDDGANPLVLRATYQGQPFVQIVKIAFPADGAPARIERGLADTGRAVVYGIYFDLASDRIKDESSATLAEVARVLQQHPSWSLDVEGHTDNIGGDAYNLDLSKRRAAAVKQALVVRYHVDGRRLRASGFGASRPRDANDTLEGRARNRRVELAKIGTGG